MTPSGNVKERSQQIRHLVSENELESAIKRLLDFTFDFKVVNNNYYDKLAITLSANYHSWKKDKQLGVISHEEDSRRLNIIITTILDILHGTESLFLETTWVDTPNRLINDKIDVQQKQEPMLQSFAVPYDQKKIVFEAERLSKSYKTFKLNEVSFKLRTGEITSIVGKNGSGKTTLIEIIAGKIKEDTGQIFYPAFSPNKVEILEWSLIKHQVAYLSQNLNKWNNISLKKLLHYEAAIHDIKGEDNLIEVDRIIQRFGLQNHIEKTWSALSTGYKWRFELARSLIWKPKLLLLDEPLANLDIRTQETILEDLQNLASSPKNPIAILISSQHLSEVDSVSDYTIYLEDGEVKYYDKTLEIGKRNQKGLFELVCELSLQDIEDALKNLNVKINHKHKRKFLIETPKNVRSVEIMRAFVDKNMDITTLSNIGDSSKNWFYEKD